MAGNKFISVVVLMKCCLLLICCTTVSSGPPRKSKKSYEPKLDLIPGKETVEGNYISYFMFNITNPEAFEAGEKPKMIQVGPYTYKETRRKYDVKKVSDSVMSYKLDRYWTFVPELSEGHKETDKFNVINIPLIILANKLSAKRLPKAFNDILVDELTEKGETLVRRGEEIGNVIYHGMNVSIYTELLDDVLQGNIPFEFQNNTFSLLKGKNGTDEGNYTVKTSGKHMGDILTFNNRTKLEYWGGDACNKIEGTDGYFFRPVINESKTIKIFYPELCRSVYLKWTGDKEVNGIKVGIWKFPEDMLESHAVKPENECFCSKPIAPTNDTKSECLKKGFVDYASCKQESPLLVSYPHFLYADSEYRDKVIGMKPLPESHESEFYIEKKTGAILKSNRKFQFNLKIRKLDNIALFHNASFMIVPVFVTERKMIVPEERITKLKEDLIKLTEEPDTIKSKELPPVQKMEDKIIGKDLNPQNDTNLFLSDEPQPQPSGNDADTAQPEPEPEPESSPEPEDKENEINSSETKYSKSQSVTKNGSKTQFTYDIFSQVVIISLSTLCLNIFV